MDPLLLEALLRSVRAVALVTGALVFFDSLSILLSPIERPPHKPKWSAVAWLIMAIAVGGVAGYLLFTKASWVTGSDPLPERLSMIGLYFGAAAGFTLRAMARAKRPALAAAALIGMTSFGVVFALADLLR